MNISYIPSVTNFLTLDLNTSDRAFDFCDFLLKKGIILRNLASFGLSRCIRVTVGIPEENDLLMQNIKEIEIADVYNR